MGAAGSHTGQPWIRPEGVRNLAPAREIVSNRNPDDGLRVP